MCFNHGSCDHDVLVNAKMWLVYIKNVIVLNEPPVNFLRFKRFILDILKKLLKILTSQYLSSLNFKLSYKPINSNSLFVSDKDLYKY